MVPSLLILLILVGLLLDSVGAFVPTEFHQPTWNKQVVQLPPSLCRSEANVVSVRLHMSDSSKNDSNSNVGGPRVNLGLVRQTVLNQALIGSTIWIPGGLGATVLANNAHFTTGAILMALVGLAPLLYFSRIVETNESPAVADLNLSTNFLVLRLFGDKPQPFIAFAVSAFLAGLTGLVEEVTFRGELLPQLSNWAVNHDLGALQGVPAGAVLSTLVFAVLHVNFISAFRNGGEAVVDALVLFAYQIVTGGLFAFLYLFSGNLAVPIVAHAFYDFYTFFNTHLQVTTQMEYARKQSLLPRGKSSSALEAKWRKQRGEEFVLGCAESFYLADLNRDGVLTREELRIALYSYGIKLSVAESDAVTQAADADQSGSIDFDEFLEFVGPNGSTGRAIKQSLLGV